MPMPRSTTSRQLQCAAAVPRPHTCTPAHTHGRMHTRTCAHLRAHALARTHTYTAMAHALPSGRRCGRRCAPPFCCWAATRTRKMWGRGWRPAPAGRGAAPGSRVRRRHALAAWPRPGGPCWQRARGREWERARCWYTGWAAPMAVRRKEEEPGTATSPPTPSRRGAVGTGRALLRLSTDDESPGRSRTYKCIALISSACGCGSSRAIMSGVRLSGAPRRVYISTAGVAIGPCRVANVPARALPSLALIWNAPAFADICTSMAGCVRVCEPAVDGGPRPAALTTLTVRLAACATGSLHLASSQACLGGSGRLPALTLNTGGCAEWLVSCGPTRSALH